MSRNYKKVIIPQQEITKLDYISCDICGKNSGKDYDDNGTIEWRDDRLNYDVAKTSISIEEGKNYPDCYSTTLKEFHVCDKCFNDKLIPLLKSEFNISPYEIEKD
jgi:hypothetical protein